ncbi:MAG: hypothetical protein A2V66_13575 [Ignavibacteria bacterium RBG_13_36_8]|nr:MAG: hypothetical protein A2V66_13575 [Ignavibacteria bacterium RBG_13_36_8]
MRKFLTILFIHLSIIAAYSQQDTSFSTEQLEDYFDNEQIDEEDSNLYDLFEYFIENPININSATIEEILRIPATDPRIAHAITTYRIENGEYNSIYDLEKITDLTQEDINKIIPFITVDGIRKESVSADSFINRIFGNTKFAFRSRTITDIQERNGYQEGKYLGSPFKNYNRVNLKFGSYVQIGAVIEKDAGEKSYWDYNSFHIAAKNIGIINNLVLGDFLIEFGQGLALWSPYSFSKGSNILGSVTGTAKKLIPYSSTDENQFFRGAASSITFGNLQLTMFYSNHRIDANIDTLTSKITSTPLDGYHRTESEENKKYRVSEKLFGISAKYHSTNFNVECLFYNSKFSNPFLPSDVFDLRGNEFRFYSIAYDSYFNNITLHGEFAYNGISIASFNTLQIDFDKNFSFIASVRNYPRNYYNIHSRGFGESNKTQNEFGVYTGFRWRSSIGTINFYYDQFKFPYATYYNPLPSKGDEFLIDYQTRPIKKTELKFRYKNEIKEVTAAINDEIKLIDQQKQNFRIELEYKVSAKFNIKSRIEYINFTQNTIGVNEEGILLFQDLKYQPYTNLRFYGRAIFFQTDSYNSRIYEFENDLQGVMTNPALYGKGMRWYFIIKYEPIDGLILTVKYSELFKPNEITLSSGLNEIEGNIDNKLSLQIDLNL